MFSTFQYVSSNSREIAIEVIGNFLLIGYYLVFVDYNRFAATNETLISFDVSSLLTNVPLDRWKRGRFLLNIDNLHNAIPYPVLIVFLRVS